MAYLMEIHFDNAGRLDRPSYLFEYAGVQFKLIQDDPKKWSDHLLTILPDARSEHTEPAFAAASDFLASLAWEQKRPTCLSGGPGGRGWADSWPLKDAKSSARTFPTLPFLGKAVGYPLEILPKIETPQQRLALTLFREAGASNNTYLSFLFYWQILCIFPPGEGMVQKLLRDKPPPFISPSDRSALPTGSRTLGEYLREDCRDAIAHISGRRHGKRSLRLESAEDHTRMVRSMWVVETLAKHFIKTRLNLGEKLILVRKPGARIPAFVDSKSEDARYPSAYPSLGNRLRSGVRGRNRTLPPPRPEQ